MERVYSSKEISQILGKPLYMILYWARKNTDLLSVKKEGKKISYLWNENSIAEIKKYFDLNSSNGTYFLTKYVSELFGLSQVTLNKWATKNGVHIEIINERKKYYWKQEDIDKCAAYFQQKKRIESYKKKETTNIDTLYHRAIRAEKKGNIEEAELYRRQIKEIKNNA